MVAAYDVCRAARIRGIVGYHGINLLIRAVEIDLIHLLRIHVHACK